jgi:hypothetical protein
MSVPLYGSQRTIALHHRNPAEADRRWRGRGREALEPTKVSASIDGTDALFAENVERKMSNPLALMWCTT